MERRPLSFPMRFTVLTLFPNAFRFIEDYSVLGRAVRAGLVSLETVDIREYATDRHHTADDYQFGGGPGMVMKPEPVFAAVETALANIPDLQRSATPVALTSPQGQILSQDLVNEFASAPGLILICGHYAGVDERIREGLVTHEVSIGDYVLTGGELAAMVIIDAVSRFVPEVVGSAENVEHDSITSGLLQHPLYTRPAEFPRHGRSRSPALRQPRRHRAVAAAAIAGADAAPAARPAEHRAADQFRPGFPGQPGLEWSGGLT